MSIERKNCTQEKGRKILVKSDFFRKELNLANGQNIQNGSEKAEKGAIQINVNKNMKKCALKMHQNDGMITSVRRVRTQQKIEYREVIYEG